MVSFKGTKSWVQSNSFPTYRTWQEGISHALGYLLPDLPTIAQEDQVTHGLEMLHVGGVGGWKFVFMPKSSSPLPWNQPQHAWDDSRPPRHDTSETLYARFSKKKGPHHEAVFQFFPKGNPRLFCFFQIFPTEGAPKAAQRKTRTIQAGKADGLVGLSSSREGWVRPEPEPDPPCGPRVRVVKAPGWVDAGSTVPGESRRFSCG